MTTFAGPRTARILPAVILMSDEWIKLRASLLNSPKLIRVARHLGNNPDFRAWLAAADVRPDALVVGHRALRAVTLALLFVTWSASRSFGRFVTDDIVLDGLTLADLDGLADAPGIGAAMASVGWAVESHDPAGIRLPNFKQYNAPRTPAERMRDHRERKVGNENVTACNAGSVTSASQKASPEKREIREENKEAFPSEKPCPADAGPTPAEFLAVWNSVVTFAAARSLSAARLKALNARRKDAYWRDNYRAALDRVAASAFCRGQNDRQWVATPDWFLRPDTVLKLLEGQYAAGSGSRPGGDVGRASRVSAEPGKYAGIGIVADNRDVATPAPSNSESCAPSDQAARPGADTDGGAIFDPFAG